MVDAAHGEESQPMSTDADAPGRTHGPQATRLVAHLRGGGRSERAMTILDLLRTRGPLSTATVRDVLGHNSETTVGRHLRDLEAEGLVEIVTPGRFGGGGRAAVWAITDHGRTVA